MPRKPRLIAAASICALAIGVTAYSIAGPAMALGNEPAAVEQAAVRQDAGRLQHAAYPR